MRKANKAKTKKRKSTPKTAQPSAALNEHDTLTDFFENAPIAIHFVNANGIIVRANKAELELLGYEPEEYIGHHILEFHSDKSRAEKLLDRLVCGDSLENEETTLVTKDGTVKNVVISSNVHWENGKFMHTRCFTRDISESKRIEERLWDNRERLALAQQAGGIGTFDWDIIHGTSRWTPELEALYGLKPGEFSGTFKEWKKMVHPDDVQLAEKATQDAIKEKKDVNVEYRIIRADKSVRWISEKARVFFNKKGEPVRMVGVNIDITERKEAEDTQQFLSKASEILSSSLDYETTLQTVARLAVPRFADWCVVHIVGEDGKTRQIAVEHADKSKVALARTIQEMYPPDPESEGGIPGVIRTGKPQYMSEIPEKVVKKGTQDAEHYRLIQELGGIYSFLTVPMIANNKVLGAISFVSAESRRPVREQDIRDATSLASRAALAVENSRLYQAAQQEISDRKLAEETIRHQALHDALTGLPNRLLLEDRLAVGLQHAKRNKEMVALLFLDLDAFKYVNDTLGHQGGDSLLQEVAQRLATCIHEDDTIARFGGDEFLIMLNKIESTEDVRKVAKKIFRSLKPIFYIDKWEIHVSTSIGIAMYPADGDTPDTLIKHADIALYRAKEAGRNTFQFYAPTTDLVASKRLTLENDLRKAISAQTLELYYQPIIDTASGTIIEAEALLRWKHPQLGIIYPNEFIPIAEEIGMIHPIGQWVLEQACKQIGLWEERGLPPIVVSINLSASQFSQPNLFENIETVLEERRIDPRQLKIEITESVAMQNISVHIPKLQILKEIGVQVAVDDFGTGYSSLSYLKRLPIDQLKIDKSFIRNCISDESDAAIIKAIVAMAHTLKLRVVAEGVETEDQLGFLSSVNCHGIQGFLISHALPATEFTAMLEQAIGLRDSFRYPHIFSAPVQ